MATYKRISELNPLPVAITGAELLEVVQNGTSYRGTISQIGQNALGVNLTSSRLPYWNGSAFVDSPVRTDGTGLGVGVAAESGTMLNVGGDVKSSGSLFYNAYVRYNRSETGGWARGLDWALGGVREAGIGAMASAAGNPERLYMGYGVDPWDNTTGFRVYNNGIAVLFADPASGVALAVGGSGRYLKTTAEDTIVNIGNSVTGYSSETAGLSWGVLASGVSAIMGGNYDYAFQLQTGGHVAGTRRTALELQTTGDDVSRATFTGEVAHGNKLAVGAGGADEPNAVEIDVAGRNYITVQAESSAQWYKLPSGKVDGQKIIIANISSGVNCFLLALNIGYPSSISSIDIAPQSFVALIWSGDLTKWILDWNYDKVNV